MDTAAEFDIDAELEAERLAEEERLLRLQEELAALDQPAPRVESQSLGRYYGPMAGEPMARSFINSNTSALGETIEAGRGEEPVDVKAIRMQGTNEFNNLVSGGMNPAEALAQTAGKIYYNDPQSMIRAVQPRSRITQPRVAAAPRIAPPKMPEDVKVGQKLALDNISDLRKQLNSDLKLATDGDKDATRRVVKNREILSELEAQAIQGSTNWQSRMNPSTNAGPVAPRIEMQTASGTGPEGGILMRQIPVQENTPEQMNRPTSQVQEIERQTPQGRIAIFDGATKKFLRWK